MSFLLTAFYHIEEKYPSISKSVQTYSEFKKQLYSKRNKSLTIRTRSIINDTDNIDTMENCKKIVEKMKMKKIAAPANEIDRVK
jgi:hypothetical protein